MNMKRDLTGQIALVTGASSGLGRAAAKALASAGAVTIINHPPRDASGSKASDLVAEIGADGGKAAAIAADVAQEDQVKRMFDEIVERFGSVHIVVANAGIERGAPVADMSYDDWKAVIDVNLNGAFLTARAAVREFLRRGPVPELSRATGKIIFTSSVHEFIPWAFQSNYAASKGGVSQLMRTLAQELAPQGIRVNAVDPGAIRTRINADAWKTKSDMDALLKLIPYGRIGEPEDVARAIVWLASDMSDYMVGASLVVDGGMSLYPSFRGAG